VKTFTDEKTKTVWYFTERNGFPTYLAIAENRKKNPSYTHSIASKETWEKL